MVFLFKILAVFALVLVVSARAINGPQKTFARVTAVLVIAGCVCLFGATAEEDFATTVGAILVLIGMANAGVMFWANFVWTVKAGLTRKRDDKL
jgi:hypothetical protein